MIKNKVNNERLKVIEAIVRNKQISFGYTALSDDTARQQALAWIGHFEEIPTERLWDAYLEAMRERDSRSLFSPTDMSQAWRRLRMSEPDYTARLAREIADEAKRRRE